VSYILESMWLISIDLKGEARISMCLRSSRCNPKITVASRSGVAQDVVIKLKIRRASTRGSELNPETISRECAVVVLFGDVLQQLHRGPGDIHRKDVAGEKEDGRCLRNSKTTVG